jgi:hypothetical protein
VLPGYHVTGVVVFDRVNLSRRVGRSPTPAVTVAGGFADAGDRVGSGRAVRAGRRADPCVKLCEVDAVKFCPTPNERARRRSAGNRPNPFARSRVLTQPGRPCEDPPPRAPTGNVAPARA